MDDPKGSSKCDVCGIDTPHTHKEFDVVQERFARKAFEDRYTEVKTSSWDGDTTIHAPMRISSDLAASYHGVENSRRWYTYINAWYDAWKHFAEIERLLALNDSQSDRSAE